MALHVGKEPESDDPMTGVTLSVFGTLIIVGFLLTPIEAATIGFTCSKAWDLALEPDYGSGPSWITWFGLYTIFAILSYKTTEPSAKRTREFVKKPIQTALSGTASRCFIALMTLAALAFTVRVFTWLQ